MNWPSDAAASGAPPQGTGTGPDNRARAARLLAEAIRVVQSIPIEYARACVLAAIARALARTDPDRAGQLAAEAERIAQAITYKNRTPVFLISTGQSFDGWEKARELSQLARALAPVGPERAERVAQSITVEFMKDEALDAIASMLAGTDPARAERIAESITGTESRASALARIADSLSGQHGEAWEPVHRSRHAERALFAVWFSGQGPRARNA